MNSDDHSSALIDASSSLLSEQRSQRTVNFNLDPPSYSSVIEDDTRHASTNRGARSSLIESQNSPYTIGSDSDHGFNADVPYSARLRSSWNSSTQPPYPTGPANLRVDGNVTPYPTGPASFRDDGNVAPYPTAPTFTTVTNRAPYPTESSNSMLGFKTDYETSRPGSRAMPEPVEMEDISIISAKTPYPMDGASGMPMPRPAPQIQNPIGFTNAVTARNKSTSPTPKYHRPYESSTRSTESPIRLTRSPIGSTTYTQLPRRTLLGSYQVKENPRRDLSNMNVIFAIFAVFLLIGIIAVVIKVIVVVRRA